MVSAINDLPAILTVAGFDPSGGAGIIADVKTFLHFGCRPLAVITSLTFQNSLGVFGMVHESATSLRAQVLPIIEENEIAELKIGLMPTAEIVSEIARVVREESLPAPVIDPIIRSSSGYELMNREALAVMLSELMPVARLITPNIPEAETLAGIQINDELGMREAAKILRELGARAVLVKGGHLKQATGVGGQGSGEDSYAIDVLDNAGQVTVLRGERIDAPPVRGTGCMLSSAIAACLAQRVSLEESVRLAKNFVGDAIRSAPRLPPEPVSSEVAEFKTEN